MLRKMPFILLLVILSALFLDKFIPLEVKSFLYSISLSIKTLIIFLLPIIIFGLLFKAASQLAHNATKIILLILVGVCVSNFTSTLLSQAVGIWVYHFDLSIVPPKSITELNALWLFQLPKLIDNAHAMLLGLILGVGMSLYNSNIAAKFSNYSEKIIHTMLAFITWILPFFVTGFILKLNHEGVIANIIEDYAVIFMVIALATLSYITFLYFLATGFNLKTIAQCIKNMLPAALTGFSTMSSAAAMPLTIIATEKNTHSEDMKIVIPATVNIHLMGDCFAIPIFAFAILKSFSMPMPSIMEYLIFAFYFVLAKFSVAAIPGGGIIVMLPILEAYLGFNAEMMSLITALYILFDPIITSANILGNGAFAMIISNFKTGQTRHLKIT